MARMNQAMTDLLRYNAAILPQKRSSFNKSHSHTTTLDSGYLVPLMWDRVLPGDEKKIKFNGLARMATPLHPVMDQANLDVWCFYIPDRLWWSHAREFYGENLDASFNPDGEYEMPHLTPQRYYVDGSKKYGTGTYPEGVGGLSDYLGMPVASEKGSVFNTAMESLNEDGSLNVTAGLHRCYQLIWNEWFRNSSVQPALQLNDGDTVTDSEWSVIRQLRKVCKYPDYFTTLLREPQAGGDVMLPLGEWAPVVSRSQIVPNIVEKKDMPPVSAFDRSSPGSNYFNYLPSSDGNITVSNGELFGSIQFNDDRSNDGLVFGNLWADLTSASRATINNLRAAITIQQLLEIDGMSGKRYQDIVKGHFGVFIPDATVQRPELLGLCRTEIGMRQVLQTSSSDDTSPQGHVGAFSLTNVANEWIANKSFCESGFIITVCAIRPIHSYSQGIDPLLQKLRRYDHYYPVFDNLGNQPVFNREIFAGWDNDHSPGNTSYNYNGVMGYKEAHAEYRIKNNRVSGLMRPDVQGTLASWNYSSDFADVPGLNSSFVSEDPMLMDRVIAVKDEPQFILDSYFDYIDIKPMGVHSIPGLTRL